MRNVLVADDHELLRHGIRRLLRNAFRTVEIFEVESSAMLLESLDERPWDVILMDILMPGGGMRETITKIRATHPHVPILIFTALTEIEHVAEAMDVGANGVIHKNRTSSDLIAAIQCVVRGETFLHPEIAEALEAMRATSDALPHRRLSAREDEIFRLIAMGHSLKNIARDLHISEKTVVTYLTRIREKTGLTSYVEIARYALQKGLVR